MCLYFRFRTERARLWRPDLSAHFQFPNAKCGSPGPESELLGVLAGPAPPTPGGWIGLEADTEAGVALSCGTSNREGAAGKMSAALWGTGDHEDRV